MSLASPRNLALAVYGVFFLVGCLAFLFSTQPTPLSPDTNALWGIGESLARDERGRVNWASVWSGGRVRVSGWDRFRSHHPLYLIDGERRPTQLEKWATLFEQRLPWLEILLDERRDVEEVVLYHGGWREQADYTNERYFLRCYSGEQLIDELGVVGNREAVARHVLNCPAVDRLRIEFDLRGLETVVRLYEVEAWGTL